MRKKNNNLDEMAAKAQERGMTYGQLQAQETLRKMREDRERNERIRRENLQTEPKLCGKEKPLKQ